MQAFSSHLLVDPNRFLGKGVSQDVEHYGEGESMCLIMLWGTASPQSRRIYWSLAMANFMWWRVYEACSQICYSTDLTFCSGCQTGSVSIFLNFIDGSLPFSHFEFGEQNRKWSHFELHHFVQHPWKPPSGESSTDYWINGWKMLTLPVWPFLTFGGSAFCPSPHLPGKVITDTNFV